MGLIFRRNKERGEEPDEHPDAADPGEELKGIHPEEEVVTGQESDEDSSAGKKLSTLKKLFGKTETPITEYEPDVHDPLVAYATPDGYEDVDGYWIDEGRSLVIIARNKETNQNEYLLIEPELSLFEHDLLERLYADLRDVLILTENDLQKDKKRILLRKINSLLNDYGVVLQDNTIFKIQYFIVRNFLGWASLNALMKDPNIEDISCDGTGIPLFLYHRTYHNIRTNVLFDETTLNSLAITLAQRSGKHVSISSPMLDATLPDGSRLQLTLGTEVTSRGSSFTIRKFRSDPFTPVELMELKTFSADALVYFWLAIENNKNLIFVGGTASGKTSSLNAVSLFIPPVAKVVSIEDTREIMLFHENWIASVTRESFVEAKGTAIDMFDLLKAAMRQRPEFILVGEVRGEEAQTLFQAMNTGHTTFSTMHANDVDAAIHRLENPPLNVPRNMVQALDIVSVQALIYHGQERVRRSIEIVEIAGIDSATGNLRVNTVFEYNPVSDSFSYTGRSRVYSTIMEQRGWNSDKMSAEVEIRKKILSAMHDQGIRDYISVSRIFHGYAIKPKKIIDNIDDLRRLAE